MSLPKRFVLDIGYTLQNYVSSVSGILNQDQFLRNLPNQLTNINLFLPSTWIEESVRQVLDILVDNVIFNTPAMFFNALRYKPNLVNIFGYATSNFHPDTKITLEKVWKEFAINIYQHLHMQIPKESNFCNYILLNILDDGLIFGEDKFYE